MSRALGAGLAGTLLLTAWASLAGATTTATTPATAASQAQINATQSKVASIEATIASEQQQSDILSQQYDAAEQRLQAVQAQLAATQATLAATHHAIRRDRARLAAAALRAYVFGSAGTQAPVLFTSSSTTAETRTEYENTAIGNLAAARMALQGAQARLAAAEASERTEEQQAQAAAAQAQSLQQQNAAATAAAEATLQQVKGTLASEVAAAAQAKAEREAAAAAAAKRAAEAKAAAQAAAQAAAVVREVGATPDAATQAANQANAAAGGVTLTTTGVSGGPSSGASGGSGSGAAALQAAESQLGVPYVWGGETPQGTPGDPSGGFDCSGLTQWAWRQAGVSIPRTSQEQYAAVSHVWTVSDGPLVLSSLQPGDLFLYDNLDGTGTVDHVAMYAGGDTIIQAPFTGTVVRYASIFTTGLVAVARP